MRGSAEGSCVHSSSHIRYPAPVLGPHVQISLKAELETVGATPISHNGASTLQSVITIQIQQIAASAHRDFQSFEGSAEPMRYEHEQVETFQGIATDKMTRSLYKVYWRGDDDAMLAALDDSFGESHESGGSRNWPRLPGGRAAAGQWTAVPPLFNSYRSGQELCWTLTCLINKDISSQEFSSLLQQILTTPVSTLLPVLTSTETVK